MALAPTTTRADQSIVFPKRIFTRILRHLISSSLVNWPIALVPAPPAVRLIDPSALIEPARSPAVPAALDV